MVRIQLGARFSSRDTPIPPRTMSHRSRSSPWTRRAASNVLKPVGDNVQLFHRNQLSRLYHYKAAVRRNVSRPDSYADVRISAELDTRLDTLVENIHRHLPTQSLAGAWGFIWTSS